MIDHFAIMGVALTFLYVASLFGYGAALCRRFFNGSDYLAARLITGCFVFYAAFIALAAFGQLHPAWVFLVWGGGLLLVVFEIRPLISELRAMCDRIREWRRKEQCLLAVICALAGAQIFCGLTPLTFYDAQVYQLLAPVQFLQAGGLVHIPLNVMTNGSMALQLTFGMSWVADPTGSVFKLLMTVFGLILLLAAARIGRVVSVQAALVAALFVAVYPEFWLHQTLGVVDLPAAAFLIYGAFWWAESLKQQDWSRAVLAGFAFGLVVASRYQGAVLVGWIFLATVAGFYDRRYRGKAAIMVSIIVVMTIPWLIRDYVIFGNPVFPLLHGVWGGPEWSAPQALQLQREVMGRPLPMLSWSRILLAPINELLIQPANGVLGIPLLFIAGFVVWSSRYRSIRMYAVIGLGGIFIWGLLRPEPAAQVLRFNAASMVFLLACMGVVLASNGEGKPRGIAAAMVLASASLVIALIHVDRLIPVWSAFFDSAARAQLWQMNVPSWRVLQYANEKLDRGHDKLLLVGETRGVWLKVPFIAPSAYNGPQLVELFSPEGNGSVWKQRLHILGVTHLLVCSSEWQRLADGYGYFRLNDRDLAQFVAWLHTLRVVFDDGHGNLLLSVS